MRFKRVHLYSIIIIFHVLYSLLLLTSILFSFQNKPSLDLLFSCALHKNHDNYCYLNCTDYEISTITNFGLRTRPLDGRFLGELGKPVFAFINKMTAQQLQMYQELETLYGFNQYISDQISVRRVLPDYREEW